MPSPFNLDWQIEDTKYTWNRMKIGRAVAVQPFSMSYVNAIGIDPGIRWGLGILLNGVLISMWGSFPKEEHDYDYFYVARKFISDWIPHCVETGMIRIAIIEGASYGSQWKQPLLEDVRLGFKVGLDDLGYNVTYVPPKSVNKRVFGNGNIAAKKTWIGINGNGADAAAVALYAGGFSYEEEVSEE